MGRDRRMCEIVEWIIEDKNRLLLKRRQTLRIPLNLITCSALFRSLVPLHSDHLFRFYPITGS